MVVQKFGCGSVRKSFSGSWFVIKNFVDEILGFDGEIGYKAMFFVRIILL